MHSINDRGGNAVKTGVKKQYQILACDKMLSSSPATAVPRPRWGRLENARRLDT